MFRLKFDNFKSYSFTYLFRVDQTLLSKETYNKFICQKKEKQRYISKDAQRTKCQALKI